MQVLPRGPRENLAASDLRRIATNRQGCEVQLGRQFDPKTSLI
jgi:hypothetical protein